MVIAKELAQQWNVKLDDKMLKRKNILNHKQS